MEWCSTIINHYRNANWNYSEIPLHTQLSSVAQSCPTLCYPMDCNTPGLPVHHQLLELTQTHVHWVSDAIQPSHPLSSPSPPAFNLCQHQGLFQWVSSLSQVAKVLAKVFFHWKVQNTRKFLQWVKICLLITSVLFLSPGDMEQNCTFLLCGNLLYVPSVFLVKHPHLHILHMMCC